MNEKTRILSTVSMYHAINDGSISVIPILFPILKTAFDLSYTQVGIITSSGLLLTLIAQIIIGRISDGKNCLSYLSMGVLLISFSMLLVTQSKGFFTLMLFMLLLRFSASFFHPIGTGWISRIFKKDRLDWAMGVQSGFADVGGFVAVLTTLYVTELTSWDFPLYVWSIAGAIILITGLFLSRNVNDVFLCAKKNNEKQNLKEALTEAFEFMKKIKILIPGLMISGAAWGTVITYLPLLLDEKTTLSLSHIGFVVAIWIGIGSIVSFYYGRISRLLGRRKVIVLAYLTIGIVGILLVFLTNILILILLMVLLGLGVFVTYPALSSFISEITDEAVEGRTFGIIFTFQLGGGTLLLLLGGVLSDLYGIWMPFAILGTVSLIIAILLIINYRSPILQPKL